MGVIPRQPRGTLQAETKSTDTKDRIVDAALQTLREEGFAGTSSGDRRQRRLRPGADLLPPWVAERPADRRPRQDQQLAHGCLSRGADRRPRIASNTARCRRHCALPATSTPKTSRPVTSLSFVVLSPGVRPTRASARRSSAYPIVATYLGMEMLAHLDGVHAKADAAFATATKIINRLGRLLGGRDKAAG